jgi:hypothetical protein
MASKAALHSVSVQDLFSEDPESKLKVEKIILKVQFSL